MSATSKVVPMVLSGGFGRRAWPLSRGDNAKQFIKRDGHYSLFQKLILQISQVKKIAAPIILANHQHKDIALEQINEIGVNFSCIIFEPERKNTCHSLTLAALEAAKMYSINTPLLAFSTDLSIGGFEKFSDSLYSIIHHIKPHQLLLFGQKVVAPFEQYGYVKVGKSVSEDLCQADSFCEKPSYELAKQYAKSNSYAWNCGIFAFQNWLYLNEMKKHNLHTYNACKKSLELAIQKDKIILPDAQAYSACDNISAEYAIIEKVNHKLILIPKMDIKAFGSWQALHNMHTKDENFNTIYKKQNIQTHNVKNSLISSDTGKVVASNVNNIVCVKVNDDVFIAPLMKNTQQKDLVLELADKSEKGAIKVNKKWGFYRVIDYQQGFKVKRIIIQPGKSISLQSHAKRSEHWIITVGKGEVTLDDKRFIKKGNDAVFIPRNSKHKIKNIGDEQLVFIEVQVGDELTEDDICRYDFQETS